MIKTPSSLKWLIKKRLRLLSEIERLEGVPALLTQGKTRFSELTAELKLVKQNILLLESITPELLILHKRNLEAIDLALGMHEISIDPQAIPSVRKYESNNLLPHGHITRRIFECLKHARGKALNTYEITTFVKIRSNLVLNEQTFNILNRTVQKRLKALCMEGKIERLHKPRSNELGVWRIPQG